MTEVSRYFVILGAMRTGSNLLEKTLEYLGDTVCYGEAFNPSFIAGPRKETVLGHTIETRDADPIAFLEQLISADPTRIAGFRMFDDHNQEVTEYILRDPRCTRIILTRDPIDSFISLKIARKTGQWMLRNPRKRMAVQVRFEPSRFRRYRKRLMAHYKWMDKCLIKYGTDAVRIDYSDLSDQARLQQLASQIGSRGTVLAEAPILRQNPESRASKVTNYAEMCVALGLPQSEQLRHVDTSPVFDGNDTFCPIGFPAAYKPVLGNAFEPMVALLHRIEVRDFGRPKLDPPTLMDRANRGALYPGDAPSNLPVFTMVSDPFRRLHAAFVREMFGPGWAYSKLRESLIDLHGPMPPSRALSRGQAEYSADRHRKHFAGFIQMVGDALNADGDVPINAEWYPQSAQFADHDLQASKLFKHEAFEEVADWLTDLMSLDRFPPGQIKGMQGAGSIKLLSIHDVATPELTDAVYQLYRSDYERFGYVRFPSGDPE